MTAAPSLPTTLIPRFSLFIEGVRRAIGEGGGRHTLGPLSILLETYLSATLRRLTALQARFAAGKLAAPPLGRRADEDRAPGALHSARTGAAGVWRAVADAAR